MSALRPRRRRLDGYVPVVRRRRHRSRSDSASAAARATATYRGAAARLALSRRVTAGGIGRGAAGAQSDRDRPALRHREAAPRRDLMEHADRSPAPRTRALFPLSSLVVDAHGAIPARLWRSPEGVSGG